jgi:hypothetical protein
MARLGDVGGGLDVVAVDVEHRDVAAGGRPSVE